MGILITCVISSSNLYQYKIRSKEITMLTPSLIQKEKSAKFGLSNNFCLERLKSNFIGNDHDRTSVWIWSIVLSLSLSLSLWGIKQGNKTKEQWHRIEPNLKKVSIITMKKLQIQHNFYVIIFCQNFDVGYCE